jgi:hypothetical protein
VCARKNAQITSGCSNILSGASRALEGTRSAARQSIDARDPCRSFLYNEFGQAKIPRLWRFNFGTIGPAAVIATAVTLFASANPSANPRRGGVGS